MCDDIMKNTNKQDDVDMEKCEKKEGSNSIIDDGLTIIRENINQSIINEIYGGNNEKYNEYHNKILMVTEALRIIFKNTYGKVSLNGLLGDKKRPLEYKYIFFEVDNKNINLCRLLKGGGDKASPLYAWFFGVAPQYQDMFFMKFTGQVWESGIVKKKPRED